MSLGVAGQAGSGRAPGAVVRALAFAALAFAALALVVGCGDSGASTPADAAPRREAGREASPVDVSRASDVATPYDLNQAQRCLAILSRYRSQLDEAKKCLAQPGSQCGQLADDWAGCGCQTPVEGSNTAALAELAKIGAEWTSQGCNLFCPVRPCPSPGKGFCSLAGGAPRCESEAL